MVYVIFARDSVEVYINVYVGTFGRLTAKFNMQNESQHMHVDRITYPAGRGAS